MADLSQVRQTFAENLVNAVYPNGINMPSVAGVEVTINDGWPIRTNLDKILQMGKAMVSIYPTNQSRVVTTFQRNFIPNTLTPATLTATVAGNTVTIGGTVSIPQAVMLIVNNIGYSYQVLITDTLSSIATALTSLISGASSIGSVITLPQSYSLIARITSNYTASAELAREDRVFMITAWCPTEAIRFQLGQAIDIYMKLNYRVPMVDNFFAQVFWHKTLDTDMLDKSLIYRRDLYYTIQYATTITQNYASISDPFVEQISFTEN